MKQIDKIKILLKNTNVNFLFGAGTSYSETNDATNFPLMKDLLKYIKENSKVKSFYNQLKNSFASQKNTNIQDTLVEIYDKYLFDSSESSKANIEKFLSILDGVEMYIQDIELKESVIKQKDCIRELIRKRLIDSKVDTVLEVYKKFYNGIKVLKEVNGLKNQTFNIFTTNYDMMNEIVMEELNIHYYSGFEGIVNRKFNLSYYNYDFVEKFQINQSNVKITPNHINLFKIHGSLSWCMEDGKLVEKNPYEQEFLPEIIYPSVDKFTNTNLIISYSALMREFSHRICKEKTTLFVSGMSMSDEHINKIIENALTLNTFHLVIFCAKEDEIKELNQKYCSNKNVIIYDEICTFEGFAEILESLDGDERNEG